MPRTSRCLLPVLLLATTAAAQVPQIPEVRTPALPARAADVLSFLPKGWAIESRVDGPVDADSRPDVVLLLRDRDPAKIVHTDGLGGEMDTNPRLVLVLVADPAGGYRRIAQSDQVIRRNTAPAVSDPLEEGGLSLEQRVLSVSTGFWTSFGSWGTSRTTCKFRWQDGCMRLIGVEDHHLQRNTGQTTDTSINLLTGRLVRSTGTIEDLPETRVNRKLPPRPPLCMDDANDGYFDDLPEG